MVLKVILASQSPRRVILLKQMGIECEQMPADIDETALVNEAPADYVLRLAKQKALAIASKMQDNHLPILAADTTVALGHDILNKPTDDIDAFNMLKRLSGSTHFVHTAVALIFKNTCATTLNTTLVQMMPLSDAMIMDYIATSEHKDKAGSYAIQGIAGCWIEKITGSYSGVMGLPVHETALLLKKLKVSANWDAKF